MKTYLADYKNADGIKKTYQNRFYGYNHTLSCEDGEIWDEKNMSSDHFPVMAPRQRRFVAGAIEQLMIGYDRTYGDLALYHYEENSEWKCSLYYNGRMIDSWVNMHDDSFRTIAWLNGVAVILPDKMAMVENGSEFILAGRSVTFEQNALTIHGGEGSLSTYFMAGDTVKVEGGGFPQNRKSATVRAIEMRNGEEYLVFDEGTFKSGGTDGVTLRSPRPIVKPLDSEVTISDQVFVTNGEIYGQPASLNTISAPINWANYFKVGDCVTITGFANPGNNVTAVIREIGTELQSSNLRFYENTFAATETASNITVTRSAPEMDYICEDENRLWGCSKISNTIYASKLGDAFNWNVYDGLATDSWAIDVGSAEEFTGCCSYQGYPTFFKVDHIYKIYGTQPSNYQLSDTMTLGVEPGSYRSLAVAGETLFYKARPGIMAYTGGAPKLISEVFGDEGKLYRDAVGGSDGVKYYVTLQRQTAANSGDPLLFVYDTRYGIWHKEDDTDALAWFYKDGFMFCIRRWTQEGIPTGVRRMIVNGEDCVNKGVTMPFTGELEIHFGSFVEFGDFVAENPNKKGLSKIQFRCSTLSSFPIIWSISYDGGTYETIYQSATHLEFIDTSSVKRSFYLPVTPHRCDNYRLKIDGYHGWRLWTLSRDEYSGSELQKH